MRKPFIHSVALIAVFLSFLYLISWDTAQAIELRNPLRWDTIEDLIKAILVFLRNLSLVVTPIVIILAGYYFVTSMGDPAKITQAKKMVLYAMIGLGIILMSEAIILLIKEVIGVQ